MEYLYPLIAINISGKTIMLYSHADVLSFIKKHGRFYEHHTYWWTRYVIGGLISTKETHEWIVRDDRGRIVKYDDVGFSYKPYELWNKNNAKIRAIADRGLPIPGTGCSKAGWKMNHPAKKNSGVGHRNRNRAKAIYEASEYNVKNNVGNRVIRHEDWR